MVNKPITISYREYIDSVVSITNNAELPAFVKVQVLEMILDKLRPMVDSELKRDEAIYRKALMDEKQEVKEDGGEID